MILSPKDYRRQDPLDIVTVTFEVTVTFIIAATGHFRIPETVS